MAVKALRKGTLAAADGHSQLPVWLNELACRLKDEYSLSGNTSCLIEAVEVSRRAVGLIPEFDKEMPTALNTLGTALSDVYERLGGSHVLDEVIDVLRQAGLRGPADYPHRSMCWDNLAVNLALRASVTGSMADLEEALKFHERTVEATPPGHSHEMARLSHYGRCLGDLFQRTGRQTDLDKAIRYSQMAVDVTPSSDPNRGLMHSNLAVQLSHKYWHTKDFDDLENAVAAAWRAVQATPDGHPDLAARTSNLGACLGDRYARTQKMSDLEDTTRVLRTAAAATPREHPEWAARHVNVGIALTDLHERTGNQEPLKEARGHFWSATQSPNASIGLRIRAGRRYMNTPRILDDERAYEVAKATTDLIPLLAPYSLKNSDKHHVLSKATGLASDAAAIALHVGEGALAAIELLETGRGVLAGSLQGIRSDLSALGERHRELEQRFRRLRDQIDTPDSRDTLEHGEKGYEQQKQALGMDRRRLVERELLELVAVIRTHPGFERFLLGPTEAEMRQAAGHGPIVVINVSSHRCDALIVEEAGIRSLRLALVSRDDVLKRGKDERSLETLSWLWENLVKPVLDDLGLGNPLPTSADGPLPRIWWIPTGPLIRFPLHAAGYHLEGGRKTALDKAVSSYATSIKAIINTRRQKKRSMFNTTSTEILLVGMEHTEGYRSLRFATEEIRAVEDICKENKPQQQLIPSRPLHNRQQHVLEALRRCRVFHFAGHGRPHAEDPMRSQLLLEDHAAAPLTVGGVLEANFTHDPPFLAYLSACGTGQVRGDDGSVDEAVHLAAAFQLAGFRHAVGTLWEVEDDFCVRMAEEVYRSMKELGMEDDDASVARGLHRAARMFRDRWARVNGGRGDDLRDEDRVAVGGRTGRDIGRAEPTWPLWTPYVHYGP